MKINKLLMNIIEEIGPEACEFSIASKTLTDLIMEFIEEYEDDFDRDEGRYLSVESGSVKGIVAIDTTPIIKDDIVSCIEDCLYELGIDEEYIEQLRNKKKEIMDDIVSVRWEAVTRDLRAMDFGANIDCIDDEIFKRIAEDNNFSGNRAQDFANQDFRDLVEGYLADECDFLIRVDKFRFENGVETRLSEIKDA